MTIQRQDYDHGGHEHGDYDHGFHHEYDPYWRHYSYWYWDHPRWDPYYRYYPIYNPGGNGETLSPWL